MPRCFWVLPASLLTKNQAQSLVFSGFAARQKLYFFSKKSWLFLKSEQLRQIFVTSFYLLFVLWSQIEKMTLFKGRHSRYMAFFYTRNLYKWEILRMSVLLKVKVLWYISIFEKIIKVGSNLTAAQKSFSHNLSL